MKRKLLCMLMGSALLLGACTLGVKEDKKVEGEDNGRIQEPIKKGEVYTASEGIYTESGDKVLLDLEVTETIRGEDALKILKEENVFNTDPIDGYEYVLVKVKGGVSKESDIGEGKYLLTYGNFTFVSDEGEVYEENATVNPEELTYKIGSGEEAEGYLSGHVKVGDKVLLKYVPVEGKEYYFLVE